MHYSCCKLVYFFMLFYTKRIHSSWEIVPEGMIRLNYEFMIFNKLSIKKCLSTINLFLVFRKIANFNSVFSFSILIMH